MVWAETLRLARIWIQATPATNIVADKGAKPGHFPPAKVVNAKTAVAMETRASEERCRRRKGMSVAPASAPVPKNPSNKPYPWEPKGCASSGRSAGKALAETLNTALRTSTAVTAGEERMWRKPSNMALIM